MKEYQEKINKEIEKFLKKEPQNKFYDIVSKYMTGGKRLRPIAVISSYEALNGKDDKIFLPALAVEFFHNSSLVHDDIMDEDSVRRNLPSCHKAFENEFLKDFKEKEYRGDIFSKESVRFGVSNSILAGNILTFLGYKCIADSNFPAEIKNKAVKRISEVLQDINHGQILDISFENKEISEEDYIDMITKKTASLIGGSFELGAMFAGKESRKWFEFGKNLGIAFQLIDDIMDVDENMQKGNTLGSAIKKGKNTLMAIKAGKFNDVKEAMDTYKKTGTIEYTRKLADERIKKAKDFVKGNGFLLEYADYITKRKS